MKKVNNDDPILRVICEPVDNVNDEIRKVLDDMTSFCAKDIQPPTLSIAANQLGINKRLIVIYANDEILKLANPTVIKTSGKQAFYEGCVNVDEEDEFCIGLVERPAYIEVQALNYDNEPVLIKAIGILAIMLLHEIDHLNGILYTDRIIGELLKFSTPKEKLDYRKEHPLKIIEEPAYDVNESINKLLRK